jgi:hypothetical protein
MKLALLFFGISKQEGYRHWSDRTFDIDYKFSCENYKKFIFDFFENKGYEIDVYLTTNILSDKDREELCEKYRPIKCSFIDNTRNIKFDNVIDLCINSGIVYDLILITRFDLLFQRDFNESNIQLTKFNLVSVLEDPHLICDNFYLFPYKYLMEFSKIVKKNVTKAYTFHHIKDDIESILPEDSINYILDERCYVQQLSFYKILRK